MATQQVAAQRSNMELGTPPMELGTPPMACAMRVAALPVEGALSPCNRSCEVGGSIRLCRWRGR